MDNIHGGTQVSGRVAGAAGTRHQLVALYRSEAVAQQASEKLLAEGVPEADIQIAAPPPDAKHDNTGLMAKVKAFFASPDEKLHSEDVHGYAESLRRGHALLIVRTRPELEQRAIIVLENTEPLDLDTHMEAWRAEGWQSQAAVTGPEIRHAAAKREHHAETHTEKEKEELLRARAELDRLEAMVNRLEVTKRAAATPVAAPPPAAHTAAMPSPARDVPPAHEAGHAEPAHMDLPTGRTERIPVFEEQLIVGKRQVGQGTVRVRSYVVEHPAEERVTLHEEKVMLERHPVDRPAAVTEQDAFRERTIEVTAIREEPVVEKEIHVVEEVEIRKEASERVETVRDTVRRTEVRVEGGREKTGRT